MAKTDPRIALLRLYMSPFDYGYRDPVSRVVKHAHKTSTVNEKLGRGWKHRVKNKMLLFHFKNESTYYYCADLEAPRLLLMVDVDCKKNGSMVGSREGALAFLQHLSETIFPGLYFEISTNGNGGHGYFFIENEGLDRSVVSKLCKRLTAWLEAERKKGFDVQFIEVKGVPPFVGWGIGEWGQPCRRLITCGLLAKIPRMAGPEDATRLAKTTCFSVMEFEKFHVAAGQKSKSLSTRKQQEPSSIDLSSVGSVCFFTEHDTKGVPALTAHLKQLGLDDLPCTSGQYRGRVLAADIAIAIVVVAKIQRLLEPEEPLRQNRIQAVWDQLFASGLVSRPFNPARWKVIRGTLSLRGLIRWIDPSYCFTVGLAGQGRAMNWRLGSELMGLVEKYQEEKNTTIVYTSCQERDLIGSEMHFDPVRRLRWSFEQSQF